MDQPGPGEDAQVVGGVGNALAELGGHLFDRALTLGEDVDDFGTSAAGQRFGRFGERVE